MTSMKWKVFYCYGNADLLLGYSLVHRRALAIISLSTAILHTGIREWALANCSGFRLYEVYRLTTTHQTGSNRRFEAFGATLG